LIINERKINFLVEQLKLISKKYEELAVNEYHNYDLKKRKVILKFILLIIIFFINIPIGLLGMCILMGELIRLSINRLELFSILDKMELESFIDKGLASLKNMNNLLNNIKDKNNNQNNLNKKNNRLIKANEELIKYIETENIASINPNYYSDIKNILQLEFYTKEEDINKLLEFFLEEYKSELKEKEVSRKLLK